MEIEHPTKLCSRSSGTSCAVRGCLNNQRKLNLWLQEPCFEHAPQTKRECPCERRYCFYRLPKEDEANRMWLKNLNLKKPPRTLYVCSFHFVDKRPTEENPHPTLWLGSRAPEKQRRDLKRKKQFCFQERQDSSNTLPCSAPLPLTDLLPDVPEHIPMEVSRSDHDYCSSGLPPPRSAAVDAVLRENQRLQAESAALRRQMEEIALRNKFGLERFAASDEDIRFYTRFESYAHLMSFWSQIEPATGDSVHVTKARSTAPTDPDAVSSRLQPIDEFFLFMTCLSLGLVPEDLAHKFNLHQSSVITIIASWANFLYAVLGAIGIWLDEDTVKRNMPEVFSHYADTHLILDVIELRCQTADSLLLHSEAFSALRPHASFKGLTGTAPHGPVTFVSPLCDSSISDRELLKQSGLIPLLQPSMAVMADKRFQVEDLVPCKVHVPAFRKTPPGARLRAHIERVKGRVKEHELFNTVIPFSLTGCISQLFVVACLLVNYQSGQLESDS